MRSLLLAFFILSLSSIALADPPTDCPPGSIGRDESGFQWCEPTVCSADPDCTDMTKVCVQMPLCVEIGSVSTEAGPAVGKTPDASKRLIVRNKCGPNHECPAQTICLEGKRCMAKTDAQKLGLLVNAVPLATASAAPTASASTGTGEAKKSCGCNTSGALSGFAIVFFFRRRKRN